MLEQADGRSWSHVSRVRPQHSRGSTRPWAIIAMAHSPPGLHGSIRDPELVELGVSVVSRATGCSVAGGAEPIVRAHVASVIGWGGSECDAAGGFATNFFPILLHLPVWF
jgi:hypothetical protein